MDIIKTTGNKEQFEEKKYLDSLRSAGIEHSLAEEVSRMVRHDAHNLANTNALHKATETALVERNQLAEAARYNLKRSISRLGPSGFPFEQYIARLFDAYGYDTKTNLTYDGKCVKHEIDVLAEKDGVHHIMECKHHHNPGAKTDVKVALYFHARFMDIISVLKKTEPGPPRRDKSRLGHKRYVGWIVTNTRATKDAIAYAECEKIKVLAWHYPKQGGLNDLIERKLLYPITALPNLHARTIKNLLSKNIILVKELQNMTPKELKKVAKVSLPLGRRLIETSNELMSDQPAV